MTTLTVEGLRRYPRDAVARRRSLHLSSAAFAPKDELVGVPPCLFLLSFSHTRSRTFSEVLFDFGLFPCNEANAKTHKALAKPPGAGQSRSSKTCERVAPPRDAPRQAEKRNQPCRVASRNVHVPCNHAAIATTVYDLGPTSSRPRAGHGRSSETCEHVAPPRHAPRRAKKRSQQ